MSRRLNLDQLYGRQPEALIVEVNGEEYRLRHPDEFGPLELAKFQRAQNLYNSLAMARGNLSDDEDTDALIKVAEAMGQTVDVLIDIICPALAELPFRMKMDVFGFYTEQVAPKKAQAGSQPETPTGEASTPD